MFHISLSLILTCLKGVPMCAVMADNFWQGARKYTMRATIKHMN